jgi:NTP pyrophosphohydrolases containing a Zn-finger, probably nucleic-acid-binding
MHYLPRLTAECLTPVFPEPSPESSQASLYLYIRGNSVVMKKCAIPSLFHTDDPGRYGLPVVNKVYLGFYDKAPCFAAEIPCDAQLPDSLDCSGVMDLFGSLPDCTLGIAAFAVRIVNFDRSSQFCGACGAKNSRAVTERAKICPACGQITYPPISPAAIVLVQNGDSLLLARSPRFPPDMYSIIAGFVEAGESIEQAVHREVMEETGITIKNLEYFGSQPWPFPHSLMTGFFAEYSGGDIKADGNEIESAGWFNRNNLPRLPGPYSIARAMIDSWLSRDDAP